MRILELVEIGKQFDGLRALDNITVGFEQGKISALIGPNGAGKSTLFNVVAGFLSPDKGKVYYKGESIEGKRPWEISRKGISILFQDARIFNGLTVIENLLSAFPTRDEENPFASLLVPRRIREDEERRKNEARKILEMFDLQGAENQLAEELSLGQQKLLAIGCLLAKGGDTLLLDEPTAGLNPKIASRLLSLLRELARKGKTILLIEHNIKTVLDVADIVYFMNEGKILAVGPPKEIVNSPYLRSFLTGL